VDHKLVQKILDTARWSPSGTNMQPWQVAVVSGGSRRSLTDKLIAARETGQQENPDYPYYPLDWYEPYKSRRRATGLALYSALNIQRGDTERQKQAWYDNYRFFGAPIGLMFFIEERLSQGSWVDMGMFIQSVMLAATGLGLATCPQFALAEYPDIVRAELAIPPELKLVTGMSLGYADPAHPLNSYRLERVPVEDFTRWYE
ncbi:MAG: nitroreductase, partial [Gammaproteobacteria bacterium]|nr:nitroreductase [Gammaproteobacteria bacterium]